MPKTPGSVPAHHLPGTTATPDDLLLADLRAGREQAFAELYVRHHRTAAGVARQIVGSGPAAEDVVADSFTALLSAVRRGGGPSSNVRSYLLTTVRNTAVGHLRARERAIPAEAEAIDRPHHDPERLVGADDEQRVRRAFAALPRRWRQVLWYVDVHDLAPAHVGPLLGISPNAVSSLARRARERLRREYLQAHQDRVAPGCEDYAPHLARFVERTLAVPVQHRVEVHVLSCEPCTTAVEQMRDLKSRMRGILLPIGLPAAATADPHDTTAAHLARAGSRATTTAGTLGASGALALGRRWWWSRPRDPWRVLLLTAPSVVLVLLAASLVSALDTHDPAIRADPPPAAVPSPVAPERHDGEPEPDELDPREPDPDAPDGPGTPDPERPGPDVPDRDPDPTDPGDTNTDRADLRPVDARPDRADHPDAPLPEIPDAGHLPGDGPPPPGSGPGPGQGPRPGPGPDRDPQVLQVAYDDLGDLVPGRPGVLGATVTNPNADGVGVVAVDLTLPPGIAFDPAGAVRAASSWTCAERPEAGGATCTVGTIARGAASTLLVPVLVGADVPEGTAVVRLDVRGDDVVPGGEDLAVPVRESPLAARYVATGDVGVAQAGAPVLHCDPRAPGCASVSDGTATGPLRNNNRWNMVPVDALGTGTNSSTAELDVPDGSEVVAARLYWAGACAGDVEPVRLAPPGGGLAAVGDADDLVVDRSGQGYQASADVTAVVRAAGAGTWAVAGVCATAGDGAWAGWALVVVHRSVGASATAGLAIVYDGLMRVTPTEGRSFAVAGRPGTSAHVSAVAWDGDRNADGNQVLLDGTPLVPLRWDGTAPAGPGSPRGAFDSTAWGSGYANALGVDARPFAPAVLEAPRAEVTTVAPADHYLLGAVAIVTGGPP
ncbi:hypothetical protein GCM10027059_09930 [Myceligenerans halotolerans]